MAEDRMVPVRQQAKEVISAILAVAGGRLHKKLALFQAFYYAHLFFWQEHQEALTDYPIVHLPQGPGIGDHFTLLAEMEEEGTLQVAPESFGPFQDYVYTLRRPVVVDPSDRRRGAIEKAVKWIEGKPAALLSEETHEYSRSWQMTRDGDEMNVYLDLLSDEEYRDMRRRLQSAEEMVQDAFAAAV